MPPPAIPKAGTGPHPKMRSGDSGTSATTPTHVTRAGNSMLPAPRIVLASPFMVHRRTTPPNTTLE